MAFIVSIVSIVAIASITIEKLPPIKTPSTRKIDVSSDSPPVISEITNFSSEIIQIISDIMKFISEIINFSSQLMILFFGLKIATSKLPVHFDE